MFCSRLHSKSIAPNSIPNIESNCHSRHSNSSKSQVPYCNKFDKLFNYWLKNDYIDALGNPTEKMKKIVLPNVFGRVTSNTKEILCEINSILIRNHGEEVKLDFRLVDLLKELQAFWQSYDISLIGGVVDYLLETTFYSQCIQSTEVSP
ncbi:MAG: hypothetical protein VX777_01080, partial [Chlamydiota bacterium]|nr:hypothetical protein [Chlamydiota bacterium]